MERKNNNFVSYIITLYNKKSYLHSVINALAKEGGPHLREYIFIDDGSQDQTFAILEKLKVKLPGKVTIISRRNMGASYSTNEAISHANGYWLRLLDGDDLIEYKSTYQMLLIARRKKVEFVYGLIHEDKKLKYPTNFKISVLQSKNEGLRKFIRNCPANSSCILVSSNRYIKAGGCNESFISPDQMLFLRLFSKGEGAFFKKRVARMPTLQKTGRLSHQIKRSRYESILALIRLCEENKKIDKNLKRNAFKRSLSRAHTYNKLLNNGLLSSHFFIYLISKFYFPTNYIKWMYYSLKVFTGKEITRPKNWLTGYDKKITSKTKIKEY